ncbi:MAG: hypothetical protein ABI353_24245 [Isosphaeraceae bacterium]
MTPQSPATLERLIRDNDLGWMIDMYAPPDRAIPFLIEQLTRLTGEFSNRFRYEVSFSPEQLCVEAARNPHKIRAFLQALAVSGSMDMLLMVWRILQGLSIREVTMTYVEVEAFSLVVTLARPGQDQEELETYSSDKINDATLLRHFGITTVDGRPLFDGFLPMRKK